MSLICPKCKYDLVIEEKSKVCTFCGFMFDFKINSFSLIKNDKYWGEFSEDNMDVLLEWMKNDKYDEARKYIKNQLGREEFIFGRGRSDFIFYLPLDKESICLDVGCGLGVHSFNLSFLSKEVYSFDQSLKRIQFCNYRKKFENVDNIRFLHTNFDNLPFSNNFFDSIIMNGVVEWVGEINKNKKVADDQIQVLKQMHDLLKSKGFLYIGIENRFAFTYLTKGRDHNGLRYTSWLPRFLADLITRIIKNKPYRTYTYSIFGYKKLLKKSGFDVQKVSFFIAHPGYNYPQFLIPFEDLSSLRFFLQTMTQNKGFLGFLVRIAASSNLFLRFTRHFFYSYVIYAQK